MIMMLTRRVRICIFFFSYTYSVPGNSVVQSLAVMVEIKDVVDHRLLRALGYDKEIPIVKVSDAMNLSENLLSTIRAKKTKDFLDRFKQAMDMYDGSVNTTRINDISGQNSLFNKEKTEFLLRACEVLIPKLKELEKPQEDATVGKSVRERLALLRVPSQGARSRAPSRVIQADEAEPQRVDQPQRGREVQSVPDKQKNSRSGSRAPSSQQRGASQTPKGMTIVEILKMLNEAQEACKDTLKGLEELNEEKMNREDFEEKKGHLFSALFDKTNKARSIDLKNVFDKPSEFIQLFIEGGVFDMPIYWYDETETVSAGASEGGQEDKSPQLKFPTKIFYPVSAHLEASLAISEKAADTKVVVLSPRPEPTEEAKEALRRRASDIMNETFKKDGYPEIVWSFSNSLETMQGYFESDGRIGVTADDFKTTWANAREGFGREIEYVDEVTDVLTLDGVFECRTRTGSATLKKKEEPTKCTVYRTILSKEIESYRLQIYGLVIDTDKKIMFGPQLFRAQYYYLGVMDLDEINDLNINFKKLDNQLTEYEWKFGYTSIVGTIDGNDFKCQLQIEGALRPLSCYPLLPKKVKIAKKEYVLKEQAYSSEADQEYTYEFLSTSEDEVSPALAPKLSMPAGQGTLAPSKKFAQEIKAAVSTIHPKEWVVVLLWALVCVLVFVMIVMFISPGVSTDLAITASYAPLKLPNETEGLNLDELMLTAMKLEECDLLWY